MSEKILDALFTVADFMAVTGLGRDSVRAAIKAGTLPGYQIGKRYVIPAGASGSRSRA